MKHEDSILVENILYNAISTFHDCDDKEKRNKYIKEFTLNFCQEHGLNPSEVVGKLKEMFEQTISSIPDTNRQYNMLLKYGINGAEFIFMDICKKWELN